MRDTPTQANIGIVEAPARLPVIMIEGKGHRVDPREIFIVEQMLLARQSPGSVDRGSSKRADHRIENGDCRHLQCDGSLPAAAERSVSLTKVKRTTPDWPRPRR